MQHPPPIDAGTLAIEGPESTGRANTVLPPLDMPPPEKAAEPPDWPSPEQNRSLVDAEGLLEPSQGEASWHATWHKSPLSARTLRGTAPLGKMHGRPPDLFDLRSEDSIVLEQDVVVPKAQKPVFVEGECARPDPWPGLDTITTDLDVCSRASVLLEGEQNKILPMWGASSMSPNHPLKFFSIFCHCLKPACVAPHPAKVPPPYNTPPIPFLKA